MTLEAIQNYLGTRLPSRPDRLGLGQLVLRLVLLAFGGALLVDVLTRPRSGLADMLAHSASIALAYLVFIVVVAAALRLSRWFSREIRVWHLWAVALFAFVAGYELSSPVLELGFVSDLLVIHHDEPISLSQLFPLWFLITYLFVQPYLNASLKLELSRLRELNQVLESISAESGIRSDQMIRFGSGRTRFALSAAAIRNIVVDDHYCRVFFFDRGAFGKRDINMPLREILKLLPPAFIQVHRSHVVNPSYVSSLRREGRNLRIVLEDGYEVPVSRHRLDTVIDDLERALSAARRNNGPKLTQAAIPG